MILRTPTYKTTLTAVVEDNIATAVWHAGDQQTVGTYIVTIVERVSTLNRDAERVGNKAMNVVDIGNAFELVPLNERPYEYDTDIESGSAIIELDANIQNPSNGLTAYELACIHGFRGTEAEWLRSLDPAWKKGWLNREHVSAEFMNMWDAVAKNAVQINTLQELLNQYYATMQNAISFRGDKEVVPAGETASITFTFDCINASNNVVLNVYHGTTLVWHDNVSVFPCQFTVSDASEGVYRCEANVDGIKYVGLWEIKESYDFWIGTGTDYNAVITNPSYKHVGASSLSGTYFLNPSAGDYIYIICRSNVVPASVTMSGFEVPIAIFDTITISGAEYSVYASGNTYQAGNIELVVNDIQYDVDSYIAHLIEEVVTIKTKADDTEEKVETIADEETITMTENSKVALKNRPMKRDAVTDEVIQKGYIILKEGDDFKEVVESYTDGNVIFEIDYAFDLGGAEVDIPENCTLKFEGGSLKGGEIVGDNTEIDARFVRIFDGVVIRGSWCIGQWECLWFGAVSDGIVNNKDAVDISFGGTDNYLPIQSALDAAWLTNVPRVHLGVGIYRIASPLNIGWWSGICNINFFGDGGNRYNSVGDNNKCTNILCDTGSYCINVNGGNGARIADMCVWGLNANVEKQHIASISNTTVSAIDNNFKLVPTAYNSNTVNAYTSNGLSQYAPYAGIITDAFKSYSDIPSDEQKYEVPTPTFDPSLPYSNPTFSSEVVLENVGVYGFALGVGCGVSASNTMTDYFKFKNISVRSCVYGVCVAAINSRNMSFFDSRFTNNFVAVTNYHFGISGTNPIGNHGHYFGMFQNCNLDHNFQIIDVYATVAPITFKRCYSENSYCIGTVSPYNYNTALIKFEDCDMVFRHSEKSANGVPSWLLYGNACFINSRISTYYDSDCDYKGEVLTMFLHEPLFENCFVGSAIRDAYCSLNNPLIVHANVRNNLKTDYSCNKIKPNYLNYNGISAYNGNFTKCKKSDAYIISVSSNRVLDVSRNGDYCELIVNKGYVNNFNISVGDILYSGVTSGKTILADNPLFVILCIESLTYNSVACVKFIAYPISGYRKVNGSLLYNSTFGTLYLQRTKDKLFVKPIEIVSASTSTLTVHDNSSEVHLGLTLSDIYNKDASFNFAQGLIEKIDTDNKTIKLPATTGFNDTYKRVYGYVENSCNNTYWKTNNSSNVFNGNLRIQTLIESFFVTISGTMERSGTAVANQTVVFLNSLNHAECVCTSDADGAYSARLSKGTYSIIRLPNRASVTSVTLTGDTTMTLEIPS